LGIFCIFVFQGVILKQGAVMTNMELVRSMRSNLFADRGTDVEAAFEDAFEIINRSREAAALSTALMVIVNTIANVIESNEKETV
jgi:hypothetical protein